MSTTQELYETLRAEGDMTYDHVTEHYAYCLPRNAVQYDNISAMRRAVESSGSHYFDRDAVRFFRGKTDGILYGRRFWVESRQFVDSDGTADPREYRVAWVTAYGDHLSIERLGSFSSLGTARTAARRLAQAVSAEDAS